MGCDILDLRCVYVNELIGSPILAVLIAGVLFFAACSYKRIGMKTTIFLGMIYFPLVCYYIAGTSAGFAFVTFIAAIILAIIHARITGNR